MTSRGTTWNQSTAATRENLVSAVRRRLWWATPLIAWNAGMVYLNFLSHSPVMTVMTAGSLAAAYIVVLSDPDEADE